MYAYMSRADFIVRANQWRMRIMWIYLQMALVVLLMFAGFWYLSQHVKLSGGAFLGLFIALILVPSFVFGSKTTSATRDLGLLCPHCKKPLLSMGSTQVGDTVGQNVYQITVTTGLCGRCGGQVLQDGAHGSS